MDDTGAGWLAQRLSGHLASRSVIPVGPNAPALRAEARGVGEGGDRSPNTQVRP